MIRTVLSFIRAVFQGPKGFATLREILDIEPAFQQVRTELAKATNRDDPLVQAAEALVKEWGEAYAAVSELVGEHPSAT